MATAATAAAASSPFLEAGNAGRSQTPPTSTSTGSIATGASTATTTTTADAAAAAPAPKDGAAAAAVAVPAAGEKEPAIQSRPTSSFFAEEVDATYAYIPLLVCCFATGVTDSTLFNVWSTFVSMQTGNTVFIALGTLGTSNNWTRSLTSLLFFVAGCFSFARFHALLGGPRLRRTLLASFLLQTACIAAAAILINARAVDGAFPTPYTADVVDYPQLVAVACLSFQAGGQIVNSRGLGLNEVPTIVITSLLCDLVSDPKLFARWRANPKRDRRAAGFVLTFLGAVCGGWVSKAAGGLAPSLWWVAAMKLAIALVWIVWKKKE